MRRQSSQTLDDLFERHRSLRGNAIAPNIIFTPIWRREDQQPAVEIIELNSSNEIKTSPKESEEVHSDTQNRNHAWSYASNEEIGQAHDRYEVNKTARERHRLRNANNITMPSTCIPTEVNQYNNDIENSFFNQSLNHMDEEALFNHQMNCFTILNNHNLLGSDTPTEGEYGDVEMITSSDIIIDRANWESRDNIYNDEVITYDADLDQNARTIWIYSYKNKHLLSDEDFEATAKIPMKMSESSSSYSTDSSGEPSKEKSTPSRRLGSPIPPTFIPRLDLSLVPTLSTVSEVSERNTHHTPNESIKFDKVNKKATNNWCTSESAKVGGVKSDRKFEKSTNIINWMGLSPREKRRVLRDKSSSDTWVGSRLNLADICKENNIGNHVDQINVVVQNDGVNVLVDVEVHADINKKIEITSVTELKSDDISKNNEISVINAAEFQKDRGDHYVKQVIATAIHPSPKTPKVTSITKQTQIDEENGVRIEITKKEKETNVYDYLLDKSESNIDDKKSETFVDRVWMKNTIPFLRPAQWTDFMPVTDSPVSYHLSLGSIIEERQTWYTRFVNFFNCCK